MVFDFTTGEDLCTGAYYANALPVVRFPFPSSQCRRISLKTRISQIELQVAKQGYRMAAWLNTIFG